MFLLVSGGYAVPERDSNLAKSFFRISDLKYCTDLIFGKTFCIFIFFHFPDSRMYCIELYWMVCIFIFHCVTVQTENRDWSFAYFIGWKNLQYPWWSIVLVGFAECLSVSLNFSNNSWNKLWYISPSACWKISSLLATRQCPLKEKKKK